MRFQYALTIVIILSMCGCTSQPRTVTLNLPTPTSLAKVATPSSPLVTVTPTVAQTHVDLPIIESDAALVPAPSSSQVSELTETAPTPTIIETIQTVELPPAIQYVDKPVYIDKPLDGMDMRERQLAFVKELNAKYKAELGYEIVGGEYCYNFTMHKEILIGYSLKLGIVTLSSNFAPLAIDSDKDMIKQLTQMISNIQEVQDAKHND